MSDVKQPLLPADPPPSYTPSANDNISSSKPRPPFPLELPVLASLRSKRVILASASPRRRALLAQIGLTNLEVKASSFAEDLPKSLGGFEYVLQTATQKAMAVYESSIDQKGLPDPELLIAADTVVVSSATGGILEKPKSEADHIRMLKMLRDTNSGRHSVITAVVAMAPLESARDPGYAMQSAVAETVVVFDPNLGDDVLQAYVKTREGADKAGGYAVQGIGALLVERIEGSFDNVVGLPLRKTLEVIEKVLMEAKGVNVDEDELVDEE